MGDDVFFDEARLRDVIADSGGHDQRNGPLISERVAVVILTAGFCVSSFAISTVRSALDHADVTDLSIARAGLYLFACIMCALIAVVLKAAARFVLAARIGIGVAIVAAVADAFTWANGFALHWVDARSADVSLSLKIFNIVYWLWFFAAWTGMYLALRYAFAVTGEQRRSREMEVLAARARLDSLRNQINPHFLFNTLNSLSSLILDRRNDDAERMVGNLAGFFRETLVAEPSDDISLREETRLQHLYLAIEQVRFPDLIVVWDVPENVMDALVPPLILQPLIENAIKHAVARTNRPVRLTIAATESAALLRLTVEDDGSSNSAGVGTGTGLRNARERLALRFGKAATCAIEQLAPGFKVTVTMPATRTR